MTPVRTMHLVSSGFWVDVRLRQIRGRWIASADSPDGPSVGVSWFPADALRAALQPFHGMVDELMDTAPSELHWR
jgi:hypothetical protein